MFILITCSGLIETKKLQTAQRSQLQSVYWQVGKPHQDEFNSSKACMFQKLVLIIDTVNFGKTDSVHVCILCISSVLHIFQGENVWRA